MLANVHANASPDEEEKAVKCDCAHQPYTDNATLKLAH